jgi:hypothetical protein
VILYVLSQTDIIFYICRVWFRIFFSYDGNFRSVRKAKKVEEGDLCLSDGSGYFPPKGPYKDWTVQVAQGQPQRAVSMINNSSRPNTRIPSVPYRKNPPATITRQATTTQSAGLAKT